MEAHLACPVSCTSPHSSQNCLRCAQFRLRAPPPKPTHSIHIPGSPYSRGKYVLHEETNERGGAGKTTTPSQNGDEMCISSLTQVVYGVIMFACLALTVVALFTPGWRKFSDDVTKDLSALQMPTQQGILPYACRMPDSNTANPTATTGNNYCDQWWQHLQQWEKAVIVCMILAVVAEIAALGWNAFTCCACCCKKYLIHPMTPLSGLVAAFLAAAIIIYGVNNKDFYGDLRAAMGTDLNNLNLQNAFTTTNTTEVGYSFWLTVCALVLALVDTIVAVVTVFFGERMC